MATPPKKPAPAPAAAEAAPAPAPKKRARGKMAMIAGIVLVLAGGAGGAWFYMHRQTAEAKTAEPEKKKAPVFLPLEQFTVNLTTVSSDHYLQVAVTLEVDANDVADQLKLMMPVVRSRILLLLAAKTAEDLATTAGKQKLIGEILAEARAPLAAGASPSKGVENVHFSAFVIQ